MLKKEHRLTKNSDFTRIFQKGFLIRKKFFLLKYVIEDKIVSSRFGFVVSGKVSKSAVVRNLIKRRIRYIIKKHKDKFNISRSFVFVFRKNAVEASFIELEQEVLNILKQIR